MSLTYRIIEKNIDGGNIMKCSASLKTLFIRRMQVQGLFFILYFINDAFMFKSHSGSQFFS